MIYTHSMYNCCTQWHTHTLCTTVVHNDIHTLCATVVHNDIHTHTHMIRHTRVVLQRKTDNVKHILFPPVELQRGRQARSNRLFDCWSRHDVGYPSNAVELTAAVHGEYQNNRLAGLSIIISINTFTVAPAPQMALYKSVYYYYYYIYHNYTK